MSDDAKPAPAKKAFNWVLVLVPVAVVSALLLAFTLPPTHALIVKGPLGPLLARIGLAASSKTVGGAKVNPPADLAADVKRLSDEVEAGRKAASEKDAHIAQLQSQLSQLQAAPQSGSPTLVPKPSPTAISEEVKRVATYWAGMDAEKAADIAGRLPEAYVRVVFSQMPADAVAEIMNVLPAKTAAKLTAGSAAEAPP